MFSVGKIIRNGGNVLGKSEALLNTGHCYLIDNDDEIPYDSNIGLFSFVPEDQFCRWVKMDEIELVGDPVV